MTVLGEDVYNHEWKVNGEVYSTTTDFDFPIIEKGDYEILYTIKNDNAESQKKFTLSAGSSRYNDRWLYWPLLKQFVITLKDDPTKAVTFRDGMTNPVIESYTGSDNQKFVNGGGWGYSDPNISLEYSTIYNVAAKKGFNEKFTPVDKTLNEDGSCSPDSWSGWYFPVDEHGNARIVHFLETWDYSATYTVAIKGVLWSVSEDKLSVQPVFYDRCKVDGERDHSDYEALEGQYYDFKLVAVEDMQ